MNIFRKLDAHAELMGNMSDRLGIDMGEQLMSGQLRPEEYRGAVLRCTHCRSVEECKSWLAGHDHADVAPEFCLNRDKLATIKARS